MDSFDFLERVEGALMWQEEKDDTMLNWMAWFTANEMISNGKLKKGSDPLKIKKSLYQSAEDVKEKEHKQKPTAEQERAKLQETFGLNK